MARPFDIIFALQRDSIFLQLAQLWWLPWCNCSLALKEKLIMFLVKRLKLLSLYLIENQMRVAFKGHEQSNVKN